jgi:hypothetical protein
MKVPDITQKEAWEYLEHLGVRGEQAKQVGARCLC